ncbi:hypothetical protein Adt_13417 [Abeliophyllum distichum]|uniref:Uncharacterized protein n=1 Tax=Abeliophyllum distichum TaxID=126358 RepID=A0ABD1TWS3_9LAMI
MSKRSLEEEGVVVDSGRVKKSRMILSQKTSKLASTSSTAAQKPLPDSFDWTESINIGSRQDELDPAILEKLPPPFVVAASSIHKYWTFVWARTTEGADLSQLIKMVEMNTARSHVLNCKLYKVVAMKVDQLCSKVVGAEDIDALCLENKTLCARLATKTRGHKLFTK